MHHEMNKGSLVTSANKFVYGNLTDSARIIDKLQVAYI